MFVFEKNITFYTYFQESSSEPAAPVIDNGLHILTEKSFKKHIETGDHFIKFYAPWCGHCQVIIRFNYRRSYGEKFYYPYRNLLQLGTNLQSWMKLREVSKLGSLIVHRLRVFVKI